jgi:hypothetical protein
MATLESLPHPPLVRDGPSRTVASTGEAWKKRAERYSGWCMAEDDHESTVCSSCGQSLNIGDHPFCPHGRPLAYRPFVPYFDHGLGIEVTSHHQRAKELKARHADVTDGLRKGDLSALNDKRMANRRELTRR